MIKFTVYGKAQSAGSKRAFPFKRKDGRLGVAVSDDNKNSKLWQAEVKAAARTAHNGTELLTGALGVTMRFYVDRPKGHFGAAGNVKASAPEFPTTRPDVLKLARGIEDACTGVVWKDDSQIVVEKLIKEFGTPRVEIEIEIL